MRTKTSQSWIERFLRSQMSLILALMTVGAVLWAKWSNSVIKKRILPQLPNWPPSLLTTRKTEIMLQEAFGLIIVVLFGSSDILVTFNLPRYLNDGCLVDPENFHQVERLLAQRFGGWTSSPSKGGWSFEGYYYTDKHICYQVLVKLDAFSIEECLQLKAALAQKFEQIEIFMYFHPVLRV